MRHADREPVLTWPTMITARWPFKRFCSPDVPRLASARALHSFATA
jgi:hypothetical protein